MSVFCFTWLFLMLADSVLEKTKYHQRMRHFPFTPNQYFLPDPTRSSYSGQEPRVMYLKSNSLAAEIFFLVAYDKNNDYLAHIFCLKSVPKNNMVD